MSYKISMTDRLSWDTVYAGKIRCYPFEKRDFKPYAQIRMCWVRGQGLHVQMLSFETSSQLHGPGRPIETGSSLALLLAPCGSSRCLCMVCGPKGDVEPRLLEKGRPARVLPVPEGYRMFRGEDLQGVYWGTEFLLSQSFLSQQFSASDFKAGDKFKGNFHTLCLEGERPYFGALYPVHSEKPDLYCPKDFGEFELVSY